MLRRKHLLFAALALLVAGPALLAGVRALRAAPVRPPARPGTAAGLITVPEKGLPQAPAVTQGELRFLARDGTYGGSCPLKHTAVSAEISGAVSRVTVNQEFTNPSKEPIEAIYVFPLPEDAAVDRMTMTLGNRVIQGEIKRREEAREIYEEAKSQGKVASLLDQERPNIFTQSVANIVPGERVLITISYTNLVKFQEGGYEFTFPTVVGPRYIPGDAAPPAGPKEQEPLSSRAPAGLAGPPARLRSLRAPTAPTPEAEGIVTDADRIRPPVTPPATRAGHDLSIKVRIDAGVPLGDLSSRLHPIAVTRLGPTSAEVNLRDMDTLPNKDFILRYEVAGGQVQSGVLTHTRGTGDGYFTLIFQPPPAPPRNWVTPKEMVFVIDTSGSQMGWPIEKAKETMELCVRQMNPDDTFQMLAFSNQVVPLFDAPQPNTPRSQAQALEFLSSRLGAGGTEMLPAVLAALRIPPDPKRLRIVCFMTDGYVGNDFQIIDAVRQNRGDARMFVFGIGNAVNRFLLEKMAEEGQGAVEYVTLEDPGDDAARRFYRRIANPLLTDIQVDWGGLKVTDVYPTRIPDLFDSGPVVITGRYEQPGSGWAHLQGSLGGRPWSQALAVALPERAPQHDALAPLWARRRLDDLMSQDWMGMQTGKPDPTVKDRMVKVALDYRLMSQYTSFVAVEHVVVTSGGKTRTVPVPVEMPEGVSYEGVFGLEQETLVKQRLGVARGRGLSYGYTASAAPAGAGGALSAGTAQPGAALPALSTRGPAAAPVTLRPGTPMATTQPGTVVVPPSAAQKNRLVVPADRLEEARNGRSAGGARAPAKPLDKLHADLARLVEATRAKDARVVSELSRKLKVKDGQVEVSIWLGDLSAGTLAKLKALGFRTLATARGSRMVLGLAPVEKLEALAKLPAVRRIAPTEAEAR